MENQNQDVPDAEAPSQPITKPETMEDVSKLPLEELRTMCNATSDELYDELVNKTDKVAGLEAERELLMASVRSLAEFNLSRQSDYEMDRSKLLTLIGESNKIKEDIQEKANKLAEISKKRSLESILTVLLDAMAKSDEESEAVAQKFLNNALEYNLFVEEYITKRKLAHLRRIKVERANSLVRMNASN